VSDELLEGETEELEEGVLAALSSDESEDEAEDEPERVAPTATISQLKKKQRVTKTVNVVVNDEETGEPMEVSLSFRGIPAHQYDRLIAAHPPRPSDKKQGYGYNPDKFGPAILAATCIDPEMTVEDATEIWKSDEWNRGERMMLLMAAIEVCTAGLNIPFKKRVSG
jgi:hypothetical protein